MDEKKTIKEKGKFALNEMVFCYEPDPLKAIILYDAKVLDIDLTKDEKGKKVFEYYIHFQGWNKSWDRWILEERILKRDEHGREVQSKLLKDCIKPKKRKRKTKNEIISDEKSDDNTTATASAQETEEEEVSNKIDIELPSVSLDMPKVLANRLEDDCYNIKRGKKLIHLPRKPSVADVLSDYYKHCQCISTKPDGRDISMTIVEELVEGLTVYFNFFLNTLLLYNFEREQYLNFFPTQQPPPHLISLHTATPPITPIPILSPKLTSLISLEKGGGSGDSKQSSRSNSRSSSMSEDVLPPAVPAKRGRGRPGRRKSNASSVDSLERLHSEKRKRTDSSSTNNTDKPMSPLSPHSAETPEDVEKRETRSVKMNMRMSDIVVKKEPVDLTDEKTEEKAKSSRLRRSSRLPKISTTSPSLLTKEVVTSPKEEVMSFARVEPSRQELLKPLTVQTDYLTVTQPLHQSFKADHSFMMYPIRDDKMTPIDIYGPEHFLRLFVKLPVLLSSSSIEQPKLKLILKYVSKLLDYLANRNDLFSESVYSESVL